MYQLAPSLLSADFKNLQRQLDILEIEGVNYIHLDVMDGVYVPNLSFGIPLIKSIRSGTNLVFDVHLMVQEPIRFIEKISNAGANVICVHYEACKDLIKTIKVIKDCGLRAGVAINPETTIDILNDNILSQIDVVHIMSIKPGIDGQIFINETLDKIKKIRSNIKRLNLKADIEVDGDINVHNVSKVIQAGANIIVSGSGVFRGNLVDNIREFKSILNDWQESEGKDEISYRN